MEKCYLKVKDNATSMADLASWIHLSTFQGMIKMTILVFCLPCKILSKPKDLLSPNELREQMCLYCLIKRKKLYSIYTEKPSEIGNSNVSLTFLKTVCIWMTCILICHLVEKPVLIYFVSKQFLCLRLKELCFFSEYFRDYSNMIVYSTRELNFQPSQNVYPNLNNNF